MKLCKLCLTLLLLLGLAVSLVIGFLGLAQAEFDPATLDDYTIVSAGFCNPFHCFLVEKDGKRYVISVDERRRIIAVWEILGDDANLVFHREML